MKKLFLGLILTTSLTSAFAEDYSYSNCDEAIARAIQAGIDYGRMSAEIEELNKQINAAGRRERNGLIERLNYKRIGLGHLDGYLNQSRTNALRSCR